MDFALTERHVAAGRTARNFALEHVEPGLRERDRACQPMDDLAQKMGEAGLLGMCLPHRYGGQGEDYHALAQICEQLERTDASPRVVMSVHVGLHMLSILQWGDEAQKERWLPDLASGKAVAAFSLTEPSAGSDAVNIKCRAERVEGGYRLHGDKRWISIGNAATQILVIAVTEPDAEKPSQRSSAFVVRTDTPGVQVGKIEGKLGVRAGDSATLTFDGAFVPEEDRLGEEGDGFKVAMSALDNGRYTVAAGACGIVHACLESSIAYAKQRTVGGEPIAAKQLIREKVARMSADLETSRLLVQKVGWLKNLGRRHTREVSLAKWLACDAAFRAADEAIEIHGAAGYTDEHPVERHFRNARGAILYEGTREIHTLLQADYAFGDRIDMPTKPPFPAWMDD